MSATIRVLRAATSGGARAEARLHASPSRRGQQLTDAVVEAIREYEPTRTGHSCVYSYNSPEHGRGRIIVELFNSIDRERMDEKVHMLEIERELGRKEPGRMPETPFWQYGFRLQTRNPYLQVLVGLLAIAVGMFPLLAQPQEPNLVLRMCWYLLGTAFIGVGTVYWLARGVIRFCWWHRARRVVRRAGDGMPSDLQILH